MGKKAYAVSAVFEKRTDKFSEFALRQMIIFDANNEDEAVGIFFREVKNRGNVDGYSVFITPTVSSFNCGSSDNVIEVPMSDLAIRKIETTTYSIEPVGVLFKTEYSVGVVTNGGAFCWLDNEELKACLGG
ncbi:hypothetical protein GCM10009007_21080 [Formosimonas limnophila]|uniref:Uncharacterized protein n=1 Tax=Formosimonas limnophila TaxID=1384487 RepID=A0A8J3CP56_9BURK|nr:hypothetical protein [Formosimonas limnophila]GHA80130.1 hypothetical protein GCM10009007_21080 [Formosimonas limnophila]